MILNGGANTNTSKAKLQNLIFHQICLGKKSIKKGSRS